MGNHRKPCDGCTQCVCDYRRCAPYQKWFTTVWEELRRHLRGGCRIDHFQSSHKLTYVHPDMIRRYLQEDICTRCEFAGNCQIPCMAYWHWWDARMVWLKWILQNGREEYDGKNRTCVH
ncbi:MAG: hypothetical protein IKT52_12185 [Oscillospiraceae bacterium]|nr:hypothetical protein [Oscillospiraceae bacterium]